jgi:hypothetical protein
MSWSLSFLQSVERSISRIAAAWAWLPPVAASAASAARMPARPRLPCHHQTTMRHTLVFLAVLVACEADPKPAPRPPPTPPPPPAYKPTPPDAAAPVTAVVDARPADPPSREPVATLQRTACFGWCPVYTVSIYRDGVIEYTGTDFVKTKGQATGVLPPDKVDAIDQLFAAAHYFDFKDTYTRYEVTDNPSAITSWHHGGKVKTIDHYHGDKHAPPALTQLEDDLDKLIGIERWIGTRAERENLAGRGR